MHRSLGVVRIADTTWFQQRSFCIANSRPLVASFFTLRRLVAGSNFPRAVHALTARIKSVVQHSILDGDGMMGQAKNEIPLGESLAEIPSGHAWVTPARGERNIASHVESVGLALEELRDTE